MITYTVIIGLLVIEALIVIYYGYLYKDYQIHNRVVDKLKLETETLFKNTVNKEIKVFFRSYSNNIISNILYYKEGQLFTITPETNWDSLKINYKHIYFANSVILILKNTNGIILNQFILHN